MSLHDKFSPSSIKNQKSPQKQSESLRQSLMQRAKQLKQKMYQQTNYFDYSINHLMNQTLKQIKKHKEQFKEKQGLLIFEQESEQKKQKKSSLKTQLIQNIEKCKNRYKKHITTIKNQRNRLYTDTKQQQSRQNVEEMLITAKNKFKKEQKQKRYHSQIFNLSTPAKKQVIHTNNRTHNMITPKKSSKLYQKLLKVNQDLTQILEDPLSFPQLKENQIKAIDHRQQHREHLDKVSPMTEKKQFYISTGTDKKVYYSPYCRFPTQSRESKNNQKIETIISQRSVFVPIGKFVRSQRKQLEINNLTKKDQKANTNEKIKENQRDFDANKRITSSSIVNEVSQRYKDQASKSNLQREGQDSLPSNRLLARETEKAKSMGKKFEKKKQNLLTQSSILQSQKMGRLKENKLKRSELMFEDVRGARIITQFTPSFEQPPAQQSEQNVEAYDKRQIKIDEGIKGKISLGDSRFMLESTRKDLLLTKPATFNNSKFKGLSQLLGVSDYKKKLSRSINLDVRGNNVRLVQSIKFQKTHKPKGSDMSQASMLI